MNADGTDVTNLGLAGYSPSWSPDGNKIAFSSGPNVGALDVFVMNADGTNVTKLTSISTLDPEPAWSPDVTKIAFTNGFIGGPFTQ
jgi:Tol biopolymer transport system component